jgi:hypothetical protein
VERSGSFDSSLSSSTGVNVSTRNSLNLGASHLLPWNQWFYSGLGEFLQSSEQRIALQTTLCGGLGRYLTNTDRASVTVLGVGKAHAISSPSSPSGQNVVAALIYAEAKLFKFSKTNLDATATLLPALSDPGPHSSEHKCVLLRQTDQQFEMECLLLRQLG